MSDACNPLQTLPMPPVEASAISQQQTELLEALGVRENVPILHPTSPDTLHPELLDSLRVRALRPADAYFCHCVSSWAGQTEQTVKDGPHRSRLSALSPHSERQALQLLSTLLREHRPSFFESPTAQPPPALAAYRNHARRFCSQAQSVPIVPSDSPFAKEFNAWVHRTGVSDCTAMAGDSAAADAAHEHAEERGRGLVVTRDVEAMETVLEIRKELLINVDVALSSEIGHALRQLREEEEARNGRGGEEAAEAAAGEDGRQAGALHDDTVAMLFLLHERRKGEQSAWSTYLKCIPAVLRTGVTALGGGGDEGAMEEGLAEVLAGTPLAARAEGETELLRGVYSALFPSLGERYPDIFGGGGFGWEDFLWARAVFDTRCITVKVPSGEGTDAGQESASGRDVTCLVPMADMCNFDPYAQLSKPLWDASSGALAFKTLAPIAAGEQLWLNYGPLDNMDLLLYYGFAIERNAYDKIELQLQPDEEEGDLGMMKRVMLAHCSLDGDHFLRLHGDGFSPKLLGALRLLHFQREDLSLTDVEPEGGPVTAENEEAVIRTLEATLASLLDALPAPPPPKPEASDLFKSAVRYKQGLREILTVNQGHIPALREGLEAWKAKKEAATDASATEEEAGAKGNQGDRGAGDSSAPPEKRSRTS